MRLEYEVIEDSFDDTTHIRTMTEQASIDGKGWLIRSLPIALFGKGASRN